VSKEQRHIRQAHGTGVVTSVVDGISYLQELHTSNAKFILQNGIVESK
jgi:hypothetical protein